MIKPVLWINHLIHPPRQPRIVLHTCTRVFKIITLFWIINFFSCHRLGYSKSVTHWKATFNIVIFVLLYDYPYQVGGGVYNACFAINDNLYFCFLIHIWINHFKLCFLGIIKIFHKYLLKLAIDLNAFMETNYASTIVQKYKY